MGHHLHAVIVSYKRRDLTERTLESFVATVSIPYSLVVVDNGSPEDVVEWLRGLDADVLELGENRYPGYATNRGWERAPQEATILLRSDNDTLWLPG
jgi:GT2 family glycosyltransferase